MVVMRNSRKIDDCVAWWWYMVLLAVAWFSRQANCLPHVFPQQGCSIKLLHSQHTKPGGCFVLVSFLSESGHMLYALSVHALRRCTHARLGCPRATHHAFFVHEYK